MLWLYLLAIVTVLVIVLRRVLHRQKPLDDELYSKSVAIDHVHSCVAWVRSDGKLGSVNLALAGALQVAKNDLIGRHWSEIFVPAERERVQEAYSRMLLSGTASLSAQGIRGNGTLAWFEVLLVAGHDHKMRFVGHHCLAVDRSREHELEEQLQRTTEEIVTAAN